jgi:hypothetical protein
MAGGTNRRTPNPQLGTHGVVDEITFHSRLVTTTSGTLALTTAAVPTWTPAGQTAVKTGSEVGRYTITLPVDYKRLLQVIATVIGADDAAYTTAAGRGFFLRDVDIGQGAAVGTVELQFARDDTGADAELIDGAQVLVTIVVAQGLVS